VIRFDPVSAAGGRRGRGMTKHDRRMAVERFTVSIEAELASAVREAAGSDEQNVSAWLADAARRHLATRGLRDVISEWEGEHGAFSDIVDASVALVASAQSRHHPAAVVTSDPADLRHLLQTLGASVRVVEV